MILEIIVGSAFFAVLVVGLAVIFFPEAFKK